MFILIEESVMKNRIFRKLLVILVIVIPAFAGTDCKKQPKCGCDGDVLFTLTRTQAQVTFNETGSNISFSPVGNPYAIYYFCNPGEMFPRLKDSKSGDILLVSGYAYWECNFLYQASNYSYMTSPVKIYQIQVTDVVSDLYGK